MNLVEEEETNIDLNQLSKAELLVKCEELGLKGCKSKTKPQLIELIQNKLDPNNIEEIKPTNHIEIDTYTQEILIENYNIHKKYVLQRKEQSKKCNLKIRLPSIPEDISENIIKFIIHKNGDTTSSWLCSTGDLYSKNEGKQECKCFTSDGPLSFTPSSEWDVIYFLDAREWLNDKFILYKVNLKKNSDEWKNIPMNKSQTFEDQCLQGRRPRIGWDALKNYITTTKIYEGTFEEIFIK